MIGTPETLTPPPRWEFLLSHHLPTRFGRTLRLAVGRRTLHLCARCTGQVVGALTVLLLFLASAPLHSTLFLPAIQVLFALAPVPSALDWLTQSLGRRESTNGLRVLSGLLLGASFADALILLLAGEWSLFLAAMGVVAIYVGALALVLRVTGGWRRVLEEHFPGLEIGDSA
ncbi:MAG: hypothetical protein A3K65_06075 [Euryarchaeota archaeon RBG_16_68_12]|nr:MAG: hypothetical protein A3K65_06075 [Euryarchaeota archaeon RBG_16_68_12]